MLNILFFYYFVVQLPYYLAYCIHSTVKTHHVFHSFCLFFFFGIILFTLTHIIFSLSCLPITLLNQWLSSLFWRCHFLCTPSSCPSFLTASKLNTSTRFQGPFWPTSTLFSHVLEKVIIADTNLMLTFEIFQHSWLLSPLWFSRLSGWVFA